MSTIAQKQTPSKLSSPSEKKNSRTGVSAFLNPNTRYSMYCKAKTTTLHMITPHEHESNTNLKDLKIGHEQSHVKNCKKLKAKNFLKNCTKCKII